MRSIRITALVLAASCMAAGLAHAQERSKGIEVNATEKQQGVNIALELKARNRAGEAFKTICEDGCDRAAPTRLAIGHDVAVCFETTTDGFATLWSIDSRGGFDLIYPNKYSHPPKTRAAPVKAGTRTCIGEDEKFRLTIGRPAGPSRVYLHWTRTEDEQLGPDDYPVIGKDTRGSPPYAAATLEYEIVGGK